MGRNRDKKRPFGEGVSRKGQKKLKLRNEAISKAREILGATGDAPVEQEKKDSDSRGGYETVMKKSDRYEAFYKLQNLIPEEEFGEFMETLRKPLPVTFRITGYKGEAQELLNIIKGKFFREMMDIELNGQRVPPPLALPWYPEEMAWQLNIAKADVRKVEALKKLHNFLIAEQEGGHITRQEAVSMIPPLLMDVKPHHRVLDLCAAPGSKTAQIIEQLHGDTGFGIPKGFVVANDVENKRCYLLVHQAKRLQSPSALIMNADAALLPNLKEETHQIDEKPKNVRFDRVLADVPCSGDGTLRKNLDIWKKWTPANGTNLHGLQRRILWRGLELLNVGGRLVYSTCSMNPVEDEAVVAAALRMGQGCVELVDVEGDLPGLKYRRGVNDWKIVSKTFDVYTSYSEVPSHFHKAIHASMFPPTEEEQKTMNLDRCMRILPHHQNTGGFFVAVFRKVGECPRLSETTTLPTTIDGENGETVNDENNDDGVVSRGTDDVNNDETDDSKLTEDEGKEGEDSQEGEEEEQEEEEENHGKEEIKGEENGGAETTEKTTRAFSPPPNGKIKNATFVEDPFVFLSWDKDKEILDNLKSFYGFEDDFPMDQLFCRCESGPKRSLYLVTKGARDVVATNTTKVKFINMGVRVFERQDTKDPHVGCAFRLTHEGVPILLPYLRRRRIPVTEEDVGLLLTRDEDSLRHEDFSEVAQKVIRTECDVAGSVAWVFTPRPESRIQCELVLAGWMGRTSGRVYIHRNQRIHFLQLLGIEWEGVIKVGPNRKDKIKMNKAEKRREAKKQWREEKYGKKDGGANPAVEDEVKEEEGGVNNVDVKTE